MPSNVLRMGEDLVDIRKPQGYMMIYATFLILVLGLHMIKLVLSLNMV
jgi:hypothetical protein